MPRPLVLLDPSATLLPRLRADARFTDRLVVDAGGAATPADLDAILAGAEDAIIALGVEPSFDQAWAQLLTIRGLAHGRGRSVLLFRQTAVRPPPAYVSVAVLDLTEGSGLGPLANALATLEQ